MAKAKTTPKPKHFTAPSKPADPAQQLETLFDISRKVNALTKQICANPQPGLYDAIRDARDDAFDLANEDEWMLRLNCLAQLLQISRTPAAIDLLIESLDDDLEEFAPFESALSVVASENVDIVREGIVRALGLLPDDSDVLAILPALVLDYGDPDAPNTLKLFLAHPTPAVVAAAIDALVELGDPSAIKLLEPLAKDTRTIETDDEEPCSPEERTIGFLVGLAIDTLNEVQLALSAMHPESLS